MTNDQFQTWWTDFKNRFTQTIVWIAADNDEKRRKAMLATWAETLGDVDLADALEVTRRMQAGSLEDWGKNTDRIPSTVRRHARDMCYLRTRKESSQDDPTTPTRIANGLRFKAMFNYVAKAVVENVPREQWLRRGVELLGPGADHQPRYTCATCLDTGFVQVWSSDAVAAFRRRELGALRARRTAVAACGCRRERDWVKSFDERKFCRCIGDGRGDADLAALEAFCDAVLPYGGREWQPA